MSKGNSKPNPKTYVTKVDIVKSPVPKSGQLPTSKNPPKPKGK